MFWLDKLGQRPANIRNPVGHGSEADIKTTKKEKICVNPKSNAH